MKMFRLFYATLVFALTGSILGAQKLVIDTPVRALYSNEIGKGWQDPKPIPPLIPSLSELSQLKAENFKLKIQLSQCQVDLLSFKSSTDLTNYQASLEGSFKKELGCKTTDKFNWATLKCETNDVKKDPVK